MKIRIKTPLSYYGGKQKLCSRIIDLIPSHTLYCEPFLGGAAVFFAKPPSEIEVLNDTNSELINFYRVLRNRFFELELMIRATIHSRRIHSDASVVYNNPHLFDEVKRAWAVWVLTTQSFSSIIDGSWGYDKKDNTTTAKIIHNRERMDESYSGRLANCQIECADALYIIKGRDTPESFFYCDPPYIDTNCGHYNGYTEQDFEKLLITLSEISGKFLLSSFPSAILDKFIKKNKWHSFEIEQKISVNKGYKRKKLEVLTANYKL